MDEYVFSDSSALPVGLEHAFWLAEEKNSLSDWHAGKDKTLRGTMENLGKIVVEKEQAVAEVRELLSLLSVNRGLSDSAHQRLLEQFKYFAVYVKGFGLVGQIAIMARVLAAQPPELGNLRQLLQERLKELLSHAAGVEHWLSSKELPYPVFALLNPERMRIFHDDVAAKIESWQ